MRGKAGLWSFSEWYMRGGELEELCTKVSQVDLLLSHFCAAAKSLQSCPTLCDPIDSSPPGSTVPGILQSRTCVGCHFLLQCKVKSESDVTQSCPTPRPHGLQPTRLLRPWDFPGKSTGVGCHCLLRSHFYTCAKTKLESWKKT